MYEQPYAINKITRTSAPFAGCFATLGKQFAKCGELHRPVPFFKFIPEVTGRLQSRDMNANVWEQVPEDSVVGLGFAARPSRWPSNAWTSTSRRPSMVRCLTAPLGLHQGVDICCNGVLE
jgi:hypothetical protein